MHTACVVSYMCSISCKNQFTVIYEDDIRSMNEAVVDYDGNKVIVKQGLALGGVNMEHIIS